MVVKVIKLVCRMPEALNRHPNKSKAFGARGLSARSFHAAMARSPGDELHMSWFYRV